MILFGDFYNPTQLKEADGGFEYSLALNNGHYIYGAHFPENPVTPGVCIIQICVELMGQYFGRAFELKGISNVKFIAVIDPNVNGELQIAFSKITPTENGYKFSALVYSETTQFAKLSLEVKEPDKSADSVCVIIPTYNNRRFLKQVVDSALQYTSSVIVVNDGSTDGTDELLAAYRSQIEVISYHPNRGKGYALHQGFDRAEALGYAQAITMDSDGQHLAEDLPLFMDAARQQPQAMIIGSRALKQENMPKGNTFANKFSNFWFTVQTGKRLPDTQTGFRLYPLAQMRGLRPFTSRYEAELELLVRLTWRNTPIISIPIHVYYPEKGVRITHFRPGMDFFRISMLNTLLCVVAVIYGYPSLLFHRAIAGLKRKR